MARLITHGSVGHYQRPLVGIAHLRSRPCGYCETPFRLSELENQLSLKMVLQLDRHLQRRGRALEWLRRVDRSVVAVAQLLKTLPVCHSCYSLYT